MDPRGLPRVNNEGADTKNGRLEAATLRDRVLEALGAFRWKDASRERIAVDVLEEIARYLDARSTKSVSRIKSAKKGEGANGGET